MGPQRSLQWGKKCFKIWKIGGETGRKFGHQVRCAPDPQSAPCTLGRAGWPEGSPCSHVGLQLGGGKWTHALSTPTPLPAWTSSSTTPSHTRLPDRGVVPTGGRGEEGESNPGHGTHVPSSVVLRSPCLFSGSARRGHEWGQNGSAFPCPVRTNGEGCHTLHYAPPLCMQGVSGWGPPSHLGGGHPEKGADGGASHPESGPDEGPAILLPGLRREG